MLEQRTVALLESWDIELVRLGALVIQDQLKGCTVMWPTLLDAHIDKSRFRWEIVDNEIYIERILLGTGIWDQLKGTGYKHTYNMGNFSMTTIEEAIGEFLNKKEQHEQEKTNE